MWKKMHCSRPVKYALLGLIAAVGVFTGVDYFFSQHSAIVPFNMARDMGQVAELFEQNRYWLTSTPNYSIEYAMLHRSPHPEPFYWGQLHTDVRHDSEGALIGFISYYMEKKTLGTMLFLAVSDAFRGKGYADQLMRHGVQKLAAMGARRIELVTRPTNHRAQKVYHRLGFHETSRDAEYVYFAYIP